MFSVIVPVHNGEKTLRRCVESMISQVSEIILIENGSSDKSHDLCNDLAKEYENVISLDGSGIRGVSAARNLGLSAVTKEYVLFCDCDDYVDSDYAETFRSAIAGGADFAICGYINHDEVVAGRTDVYGFDKEEEVDIFPLLEEIHKKCLLQQLWNKVFCTGIIKKHGIRFDESISIGEDMRFILAYLDAARPEKALLIAKPLYHYMRDQPGSLMYRMGTERIEEAIINLAAMYRLCGIPEREIQSRLTIERERQKELYAYLIMHNYGMPLREKRKLILALDSIQGSSLFRKNFTIYFKERIVKLLCKQ